MDLALARNDYVIATARHVKKIRDLPTTDRLRVLQLDVDDSAESITAKVNAAVSYWGRIDVLVNNAGFSEKILFEEGG